MPAGETPEARARPRPPRRHRDAIFAVNHPIGGSTRSKTPASAGESDSPTNTNVRPRKACTSATGFGRQKSYWLCRSRHRQADRVHLRVPAGVKPERPGHVPARFRRRLVRSPFRLARGRGSRSTSFARVLPARGAGRSGRACGSVAGSFGRRAGDGRERQGASAPGNAPQRRSAKPRRGDSRAGNRRPAAAVRAVERSRSPRDRQDEPGDVGRGGPVRSDRRLSRLASANTPHTGTDDHHRNATAGSALRRYLHAAPPRDEPHADQQNANCSAANVTAPATGCRCRRSRRPASRRA